MFTDWWEKLWEHRDKVGIIDREMLGTKEITLEILFTVCKDHRPLQNLKCFTLPSCCRVIILQFLIVYECELFIQFNTLFYLVILLYWLVSQNEIMKLLILTAWNNCECTRYRHSCCWKSTVKHRCDYSGDETRRKFEGIICRKHPFYYVLFLIFCLLSKEWRFILKALSLWAILANFYHVGSCEYE